MKHFCDCTLIEYRAKLRVAISATLAIGGCPAALQEELDFAVAWEQYQEEAAEERYMNAFCDDPPGPYQRETHGQDPRDRCEEEWQDHLARRADGCPW